MIRRDVEMQRKTFPDPYLTLTYPTRRLLASAIARARIELRALRRSGRASRCAANRLSDLRAQWLATAPPGDVVATASR